MLTKPEQGLTILNVATELERLEANYKARRKTLRALLAALEAEEVAEEQNGETDT